MNDLMSNILVACISGVFMLIGIAISSYISYLTYIKNKAGEKYKRRLIQSYKDIIALRRLEEMYCVAISNDIRNPSTPLSVKRHIRSLLRESGDLTPSDHTSVSKCQKELDYLSSE